MERRSRKRLSEVGRKRVRRRRRRCTPFPIQRLAVSARAVYTTGAARYLSGLTKRPDRRPSHLPPAPATSGGRKQDHKEDCPPMSRNYEAVYIFDSTLEDAAINDKLTRFHGLLAASEQPETSHWGRRQLAYSIGSKENGYYVVSRFSAEPTVLPEYERALKLDEGVIRYLITLHEHEVGAPALSDEELAMQAARRGDDDDGDED